MLRRALLSNLGALTTLSLAGVPACGRPPRREEVLSALVRRVVVPDTRVVLDKSDRLSRAVTTFAAMPTLDSLATARAALRQALLAWKRAQCFKNGPLVETNAFLRSAFWPARSAAIEALIRTSDNLDSERVNALGADAKGLYALEYLLFPAALADDATVAFLATEPERRRLRLADVLAQSIFAHIGRASDLLGDGAAFAQRFAQASKQSLDKVVGQMASTIETLAVNLNSVLGLAQSGLLKPGDIEGAPSHLSHELALAELVSAEHLYRSESGPSLSALVHATVPAIDERVERAFTEAHQALARLRAPLEVVVRQDRALLTHALSATKALELALKVDLASALGVTLNFQTADGD
jgi:predicted lipoprotein